MSLIGGAFGIALLNLASRNGAVERCDIATAYIGRSKLEVLLGPRIWDHTRDKDVLDFGCGPGSEAVEIAEHGARHVIGIDLRQRWLDLGVEHADGARRRGSLHVRARMERSRRSDRLARLVRALRRSGRAC